jgi:hypothetical protein
MAGKPKQNMVPHLIKCKKVIELPELSPWPRNLKVLMIYSLRNTSKLGVFPIRQVGPICCNLPRQVRLLAS